MWQQDILNEFYKPYLMFLVYAIGCLGWVVAYQFYKELTDLRRRLGRSVPESSFSLIFNQKGIVMNFISTGKKFFQNTINKFRKKKQNEIINFQQDSKDVEKSISQRVDDYYHKSRFRRVYNKWARTEAGKSSPWSLKGFGTFTALRHFKFQTGSTTPKTLIKKYKGLEYTNRAELRVIKKSIRDYRKEQVYNEISR